MATVRFTAKAAVISVLVGLQASMVFADGRGLIGWGKTMYNPTCAFACRGVIKACPLLCTPTEGGEIHGMGHSTTTTPPECFTSDPTFMRTMALCIDTYCSSNGNPPLSLIEDYWASHLATGSVGDYQWKPTVSYADALKAARADEARVASSNSTSFNSTTDHSNHGRAILPRHGGHEESDDHTSATGPQSPLPTIKAKKPLNVTSFIIQKDWQSQYNGMYSFETNEVGHSTYSIVVMLVALFLPAVLSLSRFIPGLRRSHFWAWANSLLNYPAVWGKKHREPTAVYVGGGLLPTRGQALYIAIISFLNLIFLLAPYHMIQPQSSFGSAEEQELSVIANRAGNLAMGNVVALFVFSTRNNVLLYLTNWSHGTFLLLHRWLGYWAIILTVVHSIGDWMYYVKFGDYASESAQLYWIWGIVGTVAACAILPASLLVVRQKVYELFLALHHIFTILFIIGFYYHIWYVFKYNWGYEIWTFIAIAIWGIERLWRVARMCVNGIRTATVSQIEVTNGDYLRIDVDGVRAEGVVYLCFPTSSWRFWESHPFSVISSFDNTTLPAQVITASSATDDAEKGTGVTNVQGRMINSDSSSTTSNENVRKHSTLLVRVRCGLTSRLAARVTATGGSVKLPVLVEGSYHSKMTSELSRCKSIVCIAGGVGVTAVLPILRSINASQDARLFWGVRQQALATALASEIAVLPAEVGIVTTAGKRLDIANIVRNELSGGNEKGLVGIVVCGPASMADEVRYQVTEMSSLAKRPFVLVDEAFSW